jgi:hypothetical protein
MYMHVHIHVYIYVVCAHPYIHTHMYIHTHTHHKPQKIVFLFLFFFLSTNIENSIERERTAETLVHRMSSLPGKSAIGLNFVILVKITDDCSWNKQVECCTN